MVKTEVKHTAVTSCISCSTITCLTNMKSAVRLRLTLCCRDSYIVIKSFLTRIIYLISCFVSILTRNHELKAGSLLSWSIATLIPSTVIVLYVDIITCLPEESTIIIVERSTSFSSTCHEWGQVAILFSVCFYSALSYIFVRTRCKRHYNATQCYQ